MRRNEQLHAKLDAQFATGTRQLELTHDEIDEWRNQFDIVIPVGLLAYKSIPIVCTGCRDKLPQS